MDGQEFTIVGLGEVLFDVLPSGEKSLGGAPANFAYTAVQFGYNAQLASRVGNDADGREIVAGLAARDVLVNQIQIDQTHQTGLVTVKLADGQPAYTIAEDAAWDFLKMTDDWRELAKSCHAVCFGTLAQRSLQSRQTIREFIKITSADCLRVYDVNLRPPFFDREILSASLDLANFVKFNHDELTLIAEMFEIPGADEVEQARNFKNRFDLFCLCLTRGANGSLLLREDEISEQKGLKIKLVDAIGAGDAFTAALTHGLLQNWDLNKINGFANQIGAFVASNKGAMPEFGELTII